MRIINLKRLGQDNTNYVSGGSSFVCDDPQLRTHNYNPEAWQHYYGARYYGPRISLWLGADPLAEKYPGGSPFAYCNEIKKLYFCCQI